MWVENEKVVSNTAVNIIIELQFERSRTVQSLKVMLVMDVVPTHP